MEKQIIIVDLWTSSKKTITTFKNTCKRDYVTIIDESPGICHTLFTVLAKYVYLPCKGSVCIQRDR